MARHQGAILTHYTPVKKDGQDFGKCKACSKLFSTKDSSTSGLQKHLKAATLWGDLEKERSTSKRAADEAFDELEEIFNQDNEHTRGDKSPQVVGRYIKKCCLSTPATSLAATAKHEAVKPLS